MKLREHKSASTKAVNALKKRITDAIILEMAQSEYQLSFLEIDIAYSELLTENMKCASDLICEERAKLDTNK